MVKYWFLAIVILSSLNTYSCTVFLLDNDDISILGRNFDAGYGEGLILVNKRGVSKTAIPILFHAQESFDNPARWTSKYGSVSFTPLGREYPVCGMNEVGLTLVSLADRSTIYQSIDERPEIDFQEWIQYQLDVAATVDEVINSDLILRIVQPDINFECHYFICDAKGECAVIDYVDKQMLVYQGETLPVKALTNSHYSDLLTYKEDEYDPTLEFTANSLQRFSLAAQMSATFNPASNTNPIEYAFTVLDAVKNPRLTQWHIVYDIKNIQIHFNTPKDEDTRIIDIKAFDYSCNTPMKMLDVNSNIAGNITELFIDYDKELHREFFKKAAKNYTNIFVDAPIERVDNIANINDSFLCNQASR